MKIIAKPIEMISVTDIYGNIKPIRFRISDKEEEIHTAQVLNIQTTENCKISGVKARILRCEIQLQDTMRLCELRYTLDTSIWELYKI